MKPYPQYVVLALCAIAGAQPTHIVSTGDSLSRGYWPYMNEAVETGRLDAELTKIGTKGLTSSQYVGLSLNPRDTEIRNYTQEVLDAQPDVVFFMLGTNDSYSNANARDRFLEYRDNVQQIFDAFVDAACKPAVYVATLLPVIEPGNPKADSRIDNWYNPWIKETAEAYGFGLLDLNAAIQQVDDWRNLYSPDGIHLTAEGYAWLASQWTGAMDSPVAVVPEPAALLYLVVGICAAWWKQRRKAAS